MPDRAEPYVCLLYTSCRSGGKIFRCIQRLRVEVPLVGYIENAARNVSIPDVQHAVLWCDFLNVVSSLGKNSLKQKHAQNNNGNRQKPAQQLFACVVRPQGKLPFLLYLFLILLYHINGTIREALQNCKARLSFIGTVFSFIAVHLQTLLCLAVKCIMRHFYTGRSKFFDFFFCGFLHSKAFHMKPACAPRYMTKQFTIFPVI